MVESKQKPVEIGESVLASDVKPKISPLTDDEVYALAMQAKGDPAAMPALWDAVEPMIHLWVFKRMARQGDRGTRLYEFDDLIQAGYLALAEAVEAYAPERGKFWVILNIKMRQQIAAIAGTAQSPRAEVFAKSLNEPMPGTDDSIPIDLLEDEAAEAAYDDMVESMDYSQMRAVLDECIDNLPPEQAAVIRAHYYDGKAKKDIAAAMGKSPSTIKDWEDKALVNLRKPKNAEKLRPHLYSEALLANGWHAFRDRGYVSRVEVLALAGCD